MVMENKRTILILTDWYLPAYKAGGPVQSLAGLVSAMRSQFNFLILCSAYDAFSKTPLQVEMDTWQKRETGESVFYLSRKQMRANTVSALIEKTDCDLIYLNSLFSSQFSIFPMINFFLGRINKPIVLAPRGMLGEGALSIKSSKKTGFIQLAKMGGLQSKIRWHATADAEAEDIFRVFGKKARISVIPNLSPYRTEPRTNFEKARGQLKICFISRISVKKNLLFAVEVLHEMHQGNITFDIYGPPEDLEYLEICKKRMSGLPGNVKANYYGELHPGQIGETLKKYHCFFLPTLNENYGHAIVEAMQNGCIPLLSDQTPWNQIGSEKLGFCFNLEKKEEFIVAITAILQLDADSFKMQSINIQHFILKKEQREETCRAYFDLFK